MRAKNLVSPARGAGENGRRESEWRDKRGERQRERDPEDESHHILRATRLGKTMKRNTKKKDAFPAVKTVK